MFGTFDGSAPEIVCPWAGLCELHLARKAALAAMKTAEEVAVAPVETAEEVAVRFLIKEQLRKQDDLPSLPLKERRSDFQQFIAARQDHTEVNDDKEILIHPPTGPPPPPTRHEPGS